MSASGVVAALTAPLVMSIGFIIWDIHWKKHEGSAFALNMYKCTLASIAFLIMSLLIEKEASKDEPPFQVFQDNLREVGYLILSSVIGIIVGDALWLEALQIIGSRRVIVVDATKPFVGAILDWIIIGEDLLPISLIAMIITAFGVLIVSFENENESESEEHIPKSQPTQSNELKDDMKGIEIQTEQCEGFDRQNSHVIDSLGQVDMFQVESGREYKEERQNAQVKPRNLSRRGYMFSVINVLLDSYGVVLTKQYGRMFTSWQINLVRFGFAGAFMLILSAFLRIYEKVSLGINTKKYKWYELPQMECIPWARISLGVAFVTFACPALSNYAVFEVPLGLALTLFSITPLYAIPLVWFMKKEKPTNRGTGGAIIAVVGVVLLVSFGTNRT